MRGLIVNGLFGFVGFGSRQVTQRLRNDPRESAVGGGGHPLHSRAISKKIACSPTQLQNRTIRTDRRHGLVQQIEAARFGIR